MSQSLQNYLQNHYGSKSKEAAILKKKKKDPIKKMKKKVSHSVTLVDEEPDISWKQPDEDSDEAPAVAEVQIEEKSKFKNMQEGGWVTLGEPQEDERPVIANQEEFIQENLVTTADRHRNLSKPISEKQAKKHAPSNEDPSEEGDTIYRDKFGKKISLASKRAEKFAKERKEEEEMIKQMEWGKGLVQQQEAQDRQQREEEEKSKPLARYVDDGELNEDLRNRVRWGDPGAFAGGSDKGSKKKRKGKKKKDRPKYQGVFPMNRFNIAPGYRWDGVDRSNGFEKKYILAINESQAKKDSYYKWSTEDM